MPSTLQVTSSNLTGLDYATIPDFESLLKNNFSGDKREREKSKLMKVCVDRSRSALNVLQGKKNSTYC